MFIICLPSFLNKKDSATETFPDPDHIVRNTKGDGYFEFLGNVAPASLEL